MMIFPKTWQIAKIAKYVRYLFPNICPDVKEAIQWVLPISTSLTHVHAYSKLQVYDKYWLFTN